MSERTVCNVTRSYTHMAISAPFPHVLRFLCRSMRSATRYQSSSRATYQGSNIAPMCGRVRVDKARVDACT